MASTIKITMPDEMAKEFWAWWMDGGGEDTMWECVDFCFDNNIYSRGNGEKYTLEYYVHPKQLELDL